jgi:hypothetical protein
VLWLSEFGAQNQASLLTRENPELLLAGEPLQLVPPIVFHRGVFERLRELIFSRRTPAQGTTT